MRYHVQYGDMRGSLRRYCVWDEEAKKVVFSDDIKSTVIARAQDLNGFLPVDGSERTYAEQLRLSKPVPRLRRFKWGVD